MALLITQHQNALSWAHRAAFHAVFAPRQGVSATAVAGACRPPARGDCPRRAGRFFGGSSPTRSRGEERAPHCPSRSAPAAHAAPVHRRRGRRTKIVPCRSALISAGSSTTDPRAMLMRMPCLPSAASTSALMRFLVCAPPGVMTGRTPPAAPCPTRSDNAGRECADEAGANDKPPARAWRRAGARSPADAAHTDEPDRAVAQGGLAQGIVPPAASGRNADSARPGGIRAPCTAAGRARYRRLLREHVGRIGHRDAVATRHAASM